MKLLPLRAADLRCTSVDESFMDVVGDGSRPESVQRTDARQVARPLARLITDSKAARLYERTLSAVYTVDGSRGPAANSFSNDGKGTTLLAGGRVRGGYHGDITITSDLPGGGIGRQIRGCDRRGTSAQFHARALSGTEAGSC